MAQVNKVNPLHAAIPIVDEAGRPTLEFMLKWAQQSAVNKSNQLHEVLTLSLAGLFASNEFHMIDGPPVAVTFPASGVDRSVARAFLVPTSIFRFYLVTNAEQFLIDGTTLICTVTFAAGSHDGVFDYEPTQTLPVLIPIYIVAQSALDPTMALVTLVFSGSPA